MKTTFINYIKLRELINKYGVESPSQKPYSAFTRYVIFNFMHKNGATLTKIGQTFPGREPKTYKNHSTVLAGIRKYDLMYKSRQYFDFNALRVQLEEELQYCLDSTEDRTYFNLTPIEKQILNCDNMDELLMLKNSIIERVHDQVNSTTLAESTHQSERSYSFNLVG